MKVQDVWQGILPDEADEATHLDAEERALRRDLRELDWVEAAWMAEVWDGRDPDDLAKAVVCGAFGLQYRGVL